MESEIIISIIDLIIIAIITLKIIITITDQDRRVTFHYKNTIQNNQIILIVKPYRHELMIKNKSCKYKEPKRKLTKQNNKYNINKMIMMK
jgi:hypothetical protein